MMLREELRRRLLEHRGIYVTEACDKCGKLLTWVRYTRKGDTGVWCSRECRGDCKREIRRKGGRPRKYANGEERRAAKAKQQRNYRHRAVVEKTVCSPTKTQDLEVQKTPLTQYPLTGAIEAGKPALHEDGGARV